MDMAAGIIHLVGTVIHITVADITLQVTEGIIAAVLAGVLIKAVIIVIAGQIILTERINNSGICTVENYSRINQL